MNFFGSVIYKSLPMKPEIQNLQSRLRVTWNNEKWITVHTECDLPMWHGTVIYKHGKFQLFS